MKKFLPVLGIIGAATAVALFASAKQADADLWTAFKNSQLDAVAAIAYRVEAMGFDVRTYEFRPKTAPDHTCIMAFGQTHPVGMQCVKVQ